MPETSGTEKASYGCGFVGYQSFRTTSRETYGNEAKAIPRIRIYQVSLLTGDALTRSAARKGEWKSGYGFGKRLWCAGIATAVLSTKSEFCLNEQ